MSRIIAVTLVLVVWLSLTPTFTQTRPHGGSTITAYSRQAQGLHANLDSDVPHDVMTKHHCCNSVPCAPDPDYLTLQVAGHSGPFTADTDTKNTVGAKTCNANNGDPTTLKYYSPVWKAILNCARFLSRLDIVTDNVFPKRHVYLSSKPNEFISQVSPP